MTEHVLVIGDPPKFRAQIARAIGAPTEADVAWTDSVAAAETLLQKAKHPAKLVVVSPAIAEEDALELTEFVNRRFPSTALVLVRDRVAPGLPSVIRQAGMRDVVDLSRGGEDLRAALARALAWSRSWKGDRHVRPERPAKQRRIIAVFSSKGGTGKSFLAANLAAALAGQTRSETALLDLDLDMGDVFAYFGQEPRLSFRNLVRLPEDASAAAAIDTGVRLMPNLSGYGAVTEPGADARAPGGAVDDALARMRCTFDYTIVDCPVGYSDDVLAAVHVADSIVLVLCLDVVGVKHLAAAMRTLETLGVDRRRFHVVLNRADSKVGLTARSVEKVLGMKIDAMVPSSRVVPAGLNRGRPTYLEHPRSAVARAIGALARRLADASS